MMLLKYKIKVVYHSQHPHNVRGPESTCALQFSEKTCMHVCGRHVVNLSCCKFCIYTHPVN